MALKYFRSTHPGELAAPFDCDAVNALVVREERGFMLI